MSDLNSCYYLKNTSVSRKIHYGHIMGNPDFREDSWIPSRKILSFSYYKHFMAVI